MNNGELYQSAQLPIFSYLVSNQLLDGHLTCRPRAISMLHDLHIDALRRIGNFPTGEVIIYSFHCFTALSSADAVGLTVIDY